MRVRLAGSAKAVARLPRESLTELRLAEGAAWTPALAKRVHEFVSHVDAREAALKCLAQRSHNAATLGPELARKGIAEEVASRVLAELTRDGWLNDERHAEERARTLGARHPGLDEEAATAALEGAGLDSTRARRHAQRLARDENLRGAALASVVKALRARGRRSPLAIAGAFARRGVDQTIIEEALRQEGFDAES